jgi:hypothetical protein
VLEPVSYITGMELVAGISLAVLVVIVATDMIIVGLTKRAK